MREGFYMDNKNSLDISPEKLEQIERGLRIKHIREKELKMKKSELGRKLN